MANNDVLIHDYKIYKAKERLEKPIADSTHMLTEISFVILRLRLENGIIGESYLLSFQYSPKAIVGALQDIRSLLIGKPVFETGTTLSVLDKNHEYFGMQGLLRWSQAAVNVAMWDAWGKCLQQPVWKILGPYRKKIPVYGSGGWLSYSLDELVDEATGYVERGFKTIKIKVGSPSWKTDFNRLREVRKAVGDDIRIMIDANQGLNLSTAMKLSKAVRELDIYCFEEPVQHQHFEGYKTLKLKSGIALAMGEREFDTLPLRELAVRNALDFWQPDILRLGGVEAWRKSAALAESFHIPVLPHFYKDYDVPLLCTIPNGEAAESFDWINSLIDNPIKEKDGYAYPHEEPGWGFSFLEDRLEEIKF